MPGAEGQLQGGVKGRAIELRLDRAVDRPDHQAMGSIDADDPTPTAGARRGGSGYVDPDLQGEGVGQGRRAHRNRSSRSVESNRRVRIVAYRARLGEQDFVVVHTT